MKFSLNDPWRDSNCNLKELYEFDSLSVVVIAIPGLNSQSRIQDWEICSPDPVSGLGLQIGRYFGIYNRLISCISFGRLVQKVCQNGVKSDCDCQNTNLLYFGTHTIFYSFDLCNCYF